MRLIDDAGEVPWDGTSVGEIAVSGPWIASGYFREEDGDGKFQGRWFRTGDIGSIDEHGFMRVTDRSKDVIKSGGEWISSLDAGARARRPSGGGRGRRRGQAGRALD